MLRKKLCFALMIIFLLIPANVVFANDAVSMPELGNKRGELHIDTSVSGMELSVYRVADVNVSFGEITASESKKLVKQLSDFQREHQLQGIKGVSDSLGIVSFQNLELGMYLVKQTGAVENYEMEPFLVMVPMKGENNDWIYEVTAYPKTDLVKKETVKTGDDTEMFMFLMFMLASLFVLLKRRLQAL